MEAYLQPGTYVDSNHNFIQNYAAKIVEGKENPVDQAIALYYYVRDSISYFPYFIDLADNNMKSSTFVSRHRGYCIEKAVLLASSARTIGIPSRLGFAKVRNHIGTAGLEKYLETDILVPHGYTELYLENQWVKATPAFDRKLCDKLAVAPLEFDGCSDSVFQPYSNEGNKQMEYLEDFGTFADTPRDFLLKLLKSHYPQIFKKNLKQKFLLNIPAEYLG
jgi:transglutaminase-like putative cysteine protease